MGKFVDKQIENQEGRKGNEYGEPAQTKNEKTQACREQKKKKEGTFALILLKNIFSNHN